MFWNHRVKPSITVKLIISYVLGLFIPLVLLLFYLYWMLVKDMDHQSLLFLTGEVAVIQNILSDYPASKNALREELLWEPQELHDRYYARVVDPQQNVVLQTRGMETFFSKDAFNVTQRFPRLRNVKKIKLGNGQVYAVISSKSPLKDQVGKFYTIQVAYNITRNEELLDFYLLRLAFAGLFVFIFSTVIGVWIVKNNLAPLRNMAENIKKISIHDMNYVFDEKTLPKELIPLSRAFNVMMIQLKEALDRLSQFSANIAHELRTPVNVLMMEAEITLQRVRSVEEYEAILGSSLEEYRKLADIIEKLLFIARAENKDLEPKRERFDVRVELDHLCDFYSILTEEKSIDMQCKGAGYLIADLTLFRRAVSNLISNAIKNTPVAGSITLEIEESVEELVVSVHDNGVGVPAEVLPHLVERFYSLDQARTKKQSGVGLGLAIVKSIMDIHGGRLEIQSDIGKGTVVSLRFKKY